MTNARRHWWRGLFAAVLGVGILVAITRAAPLADLGAVLLELPFTVTCGVVIISLGTPLLLDPDKLRRLLGAVGHPLSFRAAQALCYPTITLGVLAPAQSSELLKVRLLAANHGMPGWRAFGVVLVEKTLPLFAEVVMLATGWLVGHSAFHPGVTVALIVVVVLGVLQIVYRTLPRWLTPENKDTPRGELAWATRRLGGGALVGLFIYSLVYQMLDVVVLAWLCHAVGLAIPWHELMFVVAGAVLLSKLPITPGGLGVREGAIVLGLTPYCDAAAPLILVTLFFGFMKFVFPVFFTLAFFRAFLAATGQIQNDLWAGASSARQLWGRLRRNV